MPKLQITLPSGENFTRDLSEETVTVGRLPDNDLEINDISVSSHHAELTLKDGDYLLKDLQSTNGTKVNGEKGSDWDLQDGDVISFGKVLASYTSEIPSSKRSLPDSGERTVEFVSESHRPSDFTNASRFKSKSKKKDPTAVAAISLFVLGLVTFGVAMALIFTLQPPV